MLRTCCVAVRCLQTLDSYVWGKPRIIGKDAAVVWDVTDIAKPYWTSVCIIDSLCALIPGQGMLHSDQGHAEHGVCLYTSTY